MSSAAVVIGPLKVNAVMDTNKADGMTNSVGSDQTAPHRTSLIWVCTVFSDRFVPILRNLTLIFSVMITINVYPFKSNNFLLLYPFASSADPDQTASNEF